MSARQRESAQAQGGDGLPGGRRRQGRFRAGMAVGVFRRSSRRPYNYFRERPLNTNVRRLAKSRRREMAPRIMSGTGGKDHLTSCLRPTANRLCEERTYITPSDKAGVAISNSPIELAPRYSNFRPAAMTSISPSSFERYSLPSAATGEALKPLPTSGSRWR